VAKYRILIKPSAVKELKKLPPKYIPRIVVKIESLAHDPRPRGVEKLTSYENYRIRLGRYRIVYSIEDDKLIVIVIKVGHRKDIYR
jgi:mRNA interferase RelE/StbE